MAMIKELEAMMEDGNEKYLGSDPRMMMKFLAYLRESYGSAQGYLLNIGLSEEQVVQLKENFVI